MKFVNKVPSAADNQIMIPVFKMHDDELRLILSCLRQAKQYTPQVSETHIARARLRSLINTIQDYLAIDEFRYDDVNRKITLPKDETPKKNV